MSPGLAAALTGLAWASGIGLPLLAAALLLLFGGDEPHWQLVGLALAAMGIGVILAFQATLQLRGRVEDTRAEVMARLRHARTAEEARHAVRVAALFAGDPGYSEQAERLSDPEILSLCREIAERNDSVARPGPHSHPAAPFR